MENRLLSMIGLCRKAGKLLIGAENAEELIKCGRAKLIVVAGDAAENTVRKLGWLTEGTEILVRISSGKSELAKATGQRREVAVVSTADAGFAEAIRSKAAAD